MANIHRHSDTIKSYTERMSRSSAVDPTKQYFVFQLTGTIDGRIEVGVQTEWVAFESDDTTREIRKASVMNAVWWVNTWTVQKQPFLVVNETIDVALLLREGGNALVAVEAAQLMFPSFLVPQRWNGNVGKHTPRPKLELTQKAPTKKVRAAVLKRDNYRCRMCGQRPADDVNVQLDIHHIIPWEDGGLTEQTNLISLCLACHRGLHPHFEPKLFELIPDEEFPNQSALKKGPKIDKIMYAYAWAKSFDIETPDTMWNCSP